MLTADRRPPWRFPIVEAGLIQLAAALPVVGIVYVCARADVALPVYGAALLQGAAAALVTSVRPLGAWWRPIQLAFPLALVAALRLHVPPAVWLAVFVGFALVFWSTFRTQVPLYPSGPAAWRAVAELVPPDRPLALIDVGSGLGGLVLFLAGTRPACTCIGIELAPLPWLIGSLRARLQGSRARFMRGDYERLDLADYDVVFAYLSPAAMPALWRKAQAEMRPHSMLVSYEFHVPAQPPDRVVTAGPSHAALYVWNF